MLGEGASYRLKVPVDGEATISTTIKTRRPRGCLLSFNLGIVGTLGGLVVFKRQQG